MYKELVVIRWNSDDYFFLRSLERLRRCLYRDIKSFAGLEDCLGILSVSEIVLVD